MKRYLVFIALITLAAAIIWATLDKDRNAERTECVVNDTNVVLNTYRGDTLIQSQMFSGQQVYSWRRGDKQPIVQRYDNLNKDYSPFGKDMKIMRVFAGRALIISGVVVDNHCYDAMLAR